MHLANCRNRTSPINSFDQLYCGDRSADVEGRGGGTIGGKVVVMREVIGYSMS